MKFKLLLLLIYIPFFMTGQEKNDFTLEEAVSYARENSYAMLNANDDIKAANKRVWETTTMGLPQINAVADYQNFIKQPVQLIPAEFFGGNAGEFIEVSFGTKQNMSATATLSQLIFNGSYLVGLQSAKVYLKISESIKEKTEISVKQGVINAYAGVLMTREGVNILKKNKQVVENNLFQTREIIKNGFAEEQDAEQLALTLSSIDNQLNNLKRLEQYNLNMLKYAMGINIEKEIFLSQKLEDLLYQHQDLSILASPFDYTSHIDFKMAENNVQAGKLLTKLEQSKALPTLSSFINYGVYAYGEKFEFLSKDQEWYDSSIFGVQLNVPIFSSLMRSSRVQQAKINLDKSERAQLETVEKLNLAYQTAKINFESALENYNTSKEALKLAESIEKKENIKFFEGISGSFQLSSAQNQLYTKQQEYLQSIFDLINRKAALENAMGK